MLQRRSIWQYAIFILCLLGIGCKSPTISAENISIEESSSSYQHAQQELISFMESLDFAMDDLNQRGSSLESIMSQAPFTMTPVQVSYEDSPYQALRYLYEDEISATEIYFLFEHQELIYIALLDATLPQAHSMNQSIDQLIGQAWIVDNDEVRELRIIARGSDIGHLSQFIYGSLEDGWRLLNRVDYFEGVAQGPLGLLSQVMETPEELGQWIASQENGAVSEAHTDTLSVGTEVMTEAEAHADLRTQFEPMQSKMTESSLVDTLLDTFATLPADQWQLNQDEILSILGEPGDRQTYQSLSEWIYWIQREDFDYEIHRFQFLDSELETYSIEHYRLSLYEPYPTNVLDRLVELESNSVVERAQVEEVMGQPWRVVYNLPSGVVEYWWMRYPKSEISYVFLEENTRDTALDIVLEDEE